MKLEPNISGCYLLCSSTPSIFKYYKSKNNSKFNSLKFFSPLDHSFKKEKEENGLLYSLDMSPL